MNGLTFAGARPGSALLRALAIATLLFALGALIWLPVARAQTETLSDDQGDVLSCTGECSTYDQDLKEVTVSDSGGTISFTIDQYGSFTSACHCYFPQVHIFTGSTDLTAPDFYTAAYNVGPYPYPIGLFNYAVSQADPCSAGTGHYGGAYGAGNVYTITPTIVSPTEVVYSFPASAIGNPASFGWRVVEPAQSRCQTQGNPETAPLDAAPDFGTLVHGVSGGTGGDGTGSGSSTGGGAGGTAGSGTAGGTSGGGAGAPTNVKPSLSRLKGVRKAISLNVSCPAPCASLQGKGTIKAGKKSVRLRKVTHAVAGAPVALKLKISKKAQAAIRKALQAGKAVSAKVSVTALNPSGGKLGSTSKTFNPKKHWLKKHWV